MMLVLQMKCIAPGHGSAILYVSQPPDLPSQGLFLTTDPSCAIKFKSRGAAADWIDSCGAAHELGLRPSEYGTEVSRSEYESDDDLTPPVIRTEVSRR